MQQMFSNDVDAEPGSCTCEAPPNADDGSAAPEQLLPVVHCFSFEGVPFVFFVRTGDLVRLTEPAYAALSLVERGAAMGDVDAMLDARYSKEQADSVRRDLAQLRAGGYLTPELTLTSRQLDREYDALLRHRARNIMFFVTEACNLACTYCYEKNQGVHDRPLTLKQVDARRILETYFEETVGRDSICVTFFGGEPLLNFPVVRDAVQYAKELAQRRGIDVGFTMTTNLTLMTDEIADFLAEHAFHVMVSLDGNRENNDRHRIYRDGSGTYDTVTKNLRILADKMKAKGVRLPKIRATMTAENFDPIETEAHLRTLGTNLVQVGETHGTVQRGRSDYDVGHGAHEPDVFHDKLLTEMRRILSELERDPTSLPAIPPLLVKTLQHTHEEVTRSQSHASAKPKLCGVCRNMKAVTPGGDLYPCHRYVGMPNFKFGNIHEGGMDQNRVRQYYDDLHKAYAEKCVKCWARHLCGGQCPWYLSREDGSIAPPDDQTCDTLRRSFERGLGFYSTMLDRHPTAFEKLVGAKAAEMKGESAINQAPDDSCRR